MKSICHSCTVQSASLQSASLLARSEKNSINVYGNDILQHCHILLIWLRNIKTNFSKMTSTSSWVRFSGSPGTFPCWVCTQFVLSLSAWVFSGFSGFLQNSKNSHVRWTGNSELTVGEWMVILTGHLSKVSSLRRLGEAPADPWGPECRRKIESWKMDGCMDEWTSTGHSLVLYVLMHAEKHLVASDPRLSSTCHGALWDTFSGPQWLPVLVQNLDT